MRNYIPLIIIFLCIGMLFMIGGWYAGIAYTIENATVISIGEDTAWVSLYGKEFIMDAMRCY